MKKFNLFIFDVDGTLVDSLTGAVEAANKVLAARGLQTVKPEEAAHYLNHGVEYFILNASVSADPQTVKELIVAFEAEYLEHCFALPYDGVMETLQHLRERGKTLAVYSNKPYAIAAKQMELIGAGEFLHFLRADDGKTALKPSPDAILELLLSTGIAPSEALMVGDSEADLMAGCYAGISTCFVDYGIGTLVNASIKPDYILHSFTELLEMIEPSSG